jgi:hypothetical protein
MTHKTEYINPDLISIKENNAETATPIETAAP